MQVAPGQPIEPEQLGFFRQIFEQHSLSGRHRGPHRIERGSRHAVVTQRWIEMALESQSFVNCQPRTGDVVERISTRVGD